MAFDMLTITGQERSILTRLAATVAELAARPIEDTKRKIWFDHNALKPTRPLIFCDPENGWNEIIPPHRLECSHPTAREWEMRLRKEIFWGSQMNDDRVIEAVFDVSHVYSESDWGLQETRIGGHAGGAYTWDAPLKKFSEMNRLHYPQISVNAKATQHGLEVAHEIFGNFLNVRLKTAWWWTLGMTWTLINLRGLERIMFDMLDNPLDLHRLMGFLRDGTMARLDFLEQNDLLSLNNDGSYVGSGGFGWTRELPQVDYCEKIRIKDLWGFAESQETVGISPAMFSEFIFPYQFPILDRFGLNCYGCCEPLDKRWHVVEKYPRLRRISVSAWASVERMAEFLGDRYIFSWKPPPSDLAMQVFDEGAIRTKIRNGFKLMEQHHCCVEAIMKDNHTILNDPNRIIRWVEIAKEEAGA